MTVFVILHSKMQFIFSELSEQDALLSCLFFFQMTLLEFFSNASQKPEAEREKNGQLPEYSKPHPGGFL